MSGRLIALASHLRSRAGYFLGHPGFRRRPLTVLARAVGWTAHCLLKRPARATFREPPFQLLLPPKLDGGGATSAYLFREDYEPEFTLLAKWLGPGKTFVDAGANTGAFCFAAASLVGSDGHVLAVEPGALCYEFLERSQAVNTFSQLQLRRAALSDEVGTARLYHHYGRENSFGLGEAADSDVPYEEVPTTTIDELFRDHSRSVDFLKLDIEGAQEIALRGAAEVLRRDQPVILIENNAGACRRLGLDPLGAFELLEKLGYEFAAVDNRRRLQPAAPRDHRSVVCLPKAAARTI